MLSIADIFGSLPGCMVFVPRGRAGHPLLRAASDCDSIAHTTRCVGITCFASGGYFFFVLEQLAAMETMPLAEFVDCHGQARVRVTLPPNPLHPGHDPAVGWAIFFRNDFFASFILFGLDFATRFYGRWRLR